MAFEEFSDCFVWSCDQCSQQAVFPPGDFWSALTELKGRGVAYLPRRQRMGASVWALQAQVQRGHS